MVRHLFILNINKRSSDIKTFNFYFKLEESKSTVFFLTHQNPSRRLKRGKLYPIAYFTRVNIYTLYVVLKCGIGKMFNIPKYEREKVARRQKTQ